MQPEKAVKNARISEYLSNKALDLELPISGTFELSPMCNLECRMCYVRKTAAQVAAHPRPMMTLQQWLKLAQEARDAGMLFLLLTGGEPLGWPDFWPLYEELVTMGFLISINTNGSLIDESALQRFLNKPPSRINITLYGASDETYQALCQRSGMYSRVDKAITMLKAARIPVKLNCSLTPQNAHDLQAIVSYAKARDITLEVATYMFPPLRRDESLVGKNERFTPEECAFYRTEVIRLQNGEEQYKGYLKGVLDGVVPPPVLDEYCVDPVDGKIRCKAGRACFWITWDGYMSPCGMMPEPKLDLLDLGFAKAWRGIRKASDAMMLSGTCQDCTNQFVCHACAAMALAETGSTSGVPKYSCDVISALKAIAEEKLKELGGT